MYALVCHTLLCTEETHLLGSWLSILGAGNLLILWVYPFLVYLHYLIHIHIQNGLISLSNGMESHVKWLHETYCLNRKPLLAVSYGMYKNKHVNQQIIKKKFHYPKIKQFLWIQCILNEEIITSMCWSFVVSIIQNCHYFKTLTISVQ